MQFLSRLPTSPVFQPRINLDLGSHLTQLKLAGGDIITMPSCLLFHPSSESVLEIGQKAWSSLDKLPPLVEVVFPLKRGVVAYPDLATQFLKVLMRESAPQGKAQMYISPKTSLAVPSGITPVERQMLENVVQAAGLGKVQLIPKTEALFAGWFTSSQAPNQVCMIDIGSQVTEIGLFNQGKSVISTSIDFGGDDYTKALVRLLHDEYQCVVGWLTAEGIKKQYRGLPPSSAKAPKVQDYKIVVRGKGVLTGIPSTVSISGSLMRESFDRVTEDLISEIKTFMMQVPPELLTSALENGLYISGGGSVLSGVGEMLSQEFKTHFTLSKSPQEDVIRGVTFINRA